jgi:hypothetical protein
VLQNSLPHGDSAIIESDWTSRRINIAHFHLILNQCCARLSALMRWQNRLSWPNDWAAMFIPCSRGLAIQVEEPT